MKKNLLIIAAIASATLVSCSNEEFGGEEIVPITTEEVPIDFGSYFKAMTRADVEGAAAADLLGNAFVVSGYKGSSTATVGSMVFDNYKVVWNENTAHTTESNTTNWEYAGVTPIKHATNNGITSQKIKYWDYSQNQYDFIAWSTGKKEAIFEGTPGTDQVLVSAITPKTATGIYDPNDQTSTPRVAYTFTGKAADLQECYIADLVTVKKDGSTATDPSFNTVIGYKDKPVQFKFRQLGTKVRVGFYETVPGYSVRNVKFYTTGALLEKDATDPTKLKDGQIVDNATIFSAGADIYTEGIYTITFPTVDSPTSDNNNQAHVAFEALSGVQQTTTVDLGTMNYTIAEEGEKTAGKVFLGRTSNTASFAGDAANNFYAIYLPNETGANLNLRVDFTLESTDGSGEIIEVKNAKAQIPSIYTQWKPGFAYTYLFKISDKTNGRTGVYDPTQADDATVNSDPAGLYPITFDALVVNAEDGDNTQETITTVSTPSITTYQQKSTVVNADEYTVNGKDIFVTVNEGDALVTLTGKAALYTIPDGKTEAEVIDALSMQDDDAANGTIKGRSGLVLTAATKVDAATDLEANKYMLTNSVKFGADGNAISVATDQALRFTPAQGTTYAFVYTKQAANPNNDEVKYQALAFGDFPTGATKYRYNYKPAEGEYCKSDVLYFKKSSTDVYTKHTPFIGQDVSNLYVKDGNNYVIASGHAVPGTTYYYTIDNGLSYKEAKSVSYKTACGSSLYTFDGTDYSHKAEGAPANTIAYYYSDNGNDYVYAVIMPEKTENLFELDTNSYVVATETTAVDGQTYFDKYTKNNGEYYTKVIKVQ